MSISLHLRWGPPPTGRDCPASGPAATKVLRKGLTLDLDPGTFPERAVAQTAIHHIGTLVHRREAEVFDLFVFRGFALSFWEWLTDASLEYGYRVADPV